MVPNKRSFGQKVSLFFSRNEAEQREAGTTVPIGPYVPVILCVPLTYTDLAVKKKWRGKSDSVKLPTLQ